MNEVIYCPKCDSENVSVVTQKSNPQRISMDDYVQKKRGPNISYDVHIYTQYRIQCNACRYEIEWSS